MTGTGNIHPIYNVNVVNNKYPWEKYFHKNVVSCSLFCIIYVCVHYDHIENKSKLRIS